MCYREYTIYLRPQIATSNTETENASSKGGRRISQNREYLVDGDENDIAPQIMQVAVMLQEIQNKDLRKVAIEQMKILVGLNDTFK